MIHRKLVGGVVALGLVACASGVAVAAAGSAPKHAAIVAIENTKVKINRYVQDGTRWAKDTYVVRSGGTITVTNDAASEGPHTFTVEKKGALPKTAKQVNNCTICQTVGQESGFDPNSNAPPKFFFLQNGVGQSTPPNIHGPGDSAFVGPNKGDKVTLNVTAKKGTTLHFICVLHPWMQATLLVR